MPCSPGVPVAGPRALLGPPVAVAVAAARPCSHQWTAPFYLVPSPLEGVWVCQLLGFRNFPPEGSQSFKGTANEKREEAPRGGE